MYGKRGDFTAKSLIWLLFALVFLYVGLMPFGFLPYSFVMTNSLLRALIGIVGILIFIESFNYESHRRFLGILVGFIFVLVGAYIFIMGMENPIIELPFVFDVKDTFLQIILIIYAIYLAFGAFKQD
jgi:uncharacterized membrane protein HdeD (DUF308 family)